MHEVFYVHLISNTEKITNTKIVKAVPQIIKTNVKFLKHPGGKSSWGKWPLGVYLWSLNPTYIILAFCRRLKYHLQIHSLPTFRKSILNYHFLDYLLFRQAKEKEGRRQRDTKLVPQVAKSAFEQNFSGQ